MYATGDVSVIAYMSYHIMHANSVCFRVAQCMKCRCGSCAGAMWQLCRGADNCAEVLSVDLAGRDITGGETKGHFA